MKRFLTISLLLAFGSFGSVGCGGESEEDLLKNSLDEYEDEINDQVEITCECSDELGHATVDECKTMRGEILPARRRCIDDAFARDIDAADQYISCALPLEREYTTCLNDKLSCDDLASAMPCSDDYATGLENCITLPQATQRALDECYN